MWKGVGGSVFGNDADGFVPVWRTEESSRCCRPERLLLQDHQISAILPADSSPELLARAVMAVNEYGGLVDANRGELGEADIDDGPADSLLSVLRGNCQVVHVSPATVVTAED